MRTRRSAASRMRVGGASSRTRAATGCWRAGLLFRRLDALVLGIKDIARLAFGMRCAAMGQGRSGPCGDEEGGGERRQNDLLHLKFSVTRLASARASGRGARAGAGREGDAAIVRRSVSR